MTVVVVACVSSASAVTLVAVTLAVFVIALGVVAVTTIVIVTELSPARVPTSHLTAPSFGLGGPPGVRVQVVPCGAVIELK